MQGCGRNLAAPRDHEDLLDVDREHGEARNVQSHPGNSHKRHIGRRSDFHVTNVPVRAGPIYAQAHLRAMRKIKSSPSEVLRTSKVDEMTSGDS